MITNNLLIRLKDRTSSNIAKTRDVLLSMQGQIEVLRDIRVELDVRHGPSSYDLMLIAQFASMQDLEAYLGHPLHVKVAQYIAGVLEAAASVCYES
jgi:hypothetical protein